MRISDWSSDVCSSDLSPFTAENGATRLWPHSHRPDADPMPDAEPIAIEMEPGSVLLFLGSTLHGGGEKDRKSVVEGKSVSVRVDLGGRRIIKKKNSDRDIRCDMSNIEDN